MVLKANLSDQVVKIGSYIFNINFINFVEYNYHLKIIYMPEYLYLI